MVSTLNNLFSITPTFLIGRRVEDGKDFKTVSPFIIHNTIRDLVGEVRTLKKLRNGSIFVETRNRLQTETLLACSSLKHKEIIKVKFEPHTTLNKSKGIIRCPDLDCVSLDEIVSELRDQFVSDVKRMTISKNGQKIKTHSYLLTFNTPLPPQNIRIAFFHCQVKIYVPPPIRCFSCFKFNHTSSSCSKGNMCSECGDEKHELHNYSCTKPKKCSNCGGNHSAWDKSCPIYTKEFEIKMIQVKDKISYFAAKSKYNRAAGVTLKRPFSQVLKPNTVSIGTQTDSQQTEVGTNSAKAPVRREAMHMSSHGSKISGNSCLVSPPSTTTDEPCSSEQQCEGPVSAPTTYISVATPTTYSTYPPVSTPSSYPPVSTPTTYPPVSTLSTYPPVSTPSTYPPVSTLTTTICDACRSVQQCEDLTPPPLALNSDTSTTPLPKPGPKRTHRLDEESNSQNISSLLPKEKRVTKKRNTRKNNCTNPKVGHKNSNSA